MAILQFIKPDKVILLNSDDFRGQFEFRPLEPGYGITIGNALRRVLLSSLEGYAISSIKIEGVEHEFSTISGVIEDVTEIILNLKQVRFKAKTENPANEQVSVKISGKEVITAGDLGKGLNGFEIINKDLVICNLDKSVTFEITYNVEKGRGYVPSEQNKSNNAPIGTIAIDSIFTPIKKVNYSTENIRFNDRTDYEKLIIEVKTDGSITPEEAVGMAAKIMYKHLTLFVDMTEKARELSVMSQNTVEEVDSVLQRSVEDLGLSKRPLNCLRIKEIKTVAELTNFTLDEVKKFKNLGAKSLEEIVDKVAELNLEFRKED